MDPEGTAESFPSLQGLGEAPALFQQDAESFSNQGGAPALHRMYSENSASNSASSLEEHMSSRHKLSEVVTKLNIMVTCLQECVSTLVELQSDSFNQQDAHLGTRESSFSSLTSFRNIGNNSNNSNNKQEEKRSSLGELTPRTCRSKSEEGSHPEELKPNKLEQEEAKTRRTRTSSSTTACCTTKGSRTTTTTTTTKTTTATKSLKQRSKSSFQNTRDGVTYAGRKDTQQKLAGTTTRGTSSTNKLG